MQDFLNQFTVFWDDHIKGLFSEDPEKYDMRPYRDWAILVALAGIGVALLLAIDIYMFIAVNTPPDIRESPQARLQETIDREALADTIERYRQKEQRLEELRAAPPAIAAPR